MAAEDSSRKYKAGADVIGALLETAVYSILYTRAVYPSILFEKRQVFAVPTPWPRAQPLIDYVKTAVDAVIKWLSQEKVVIERFVFDINISSMKECSSLHPERLEQHLRGVLVKLSMCDALLPSHDVVEKSFRLYAITPAKNELSASRDSTMPWVVADRDTEIGECLDAFNQRSVPEIRGRSKLPKMEKEQPKTISEDEISKQHFSGLCDSSKFSKHSDRYISTRRMGTSMHILKQVDVSPFLLVVYVEETTSRTDSSSTTTASSLPS
eukprot:gene9295-1562_t